MIRLLGRFSLPRSRACFPSLMVVDAASAALVVRYITSVACYSICVPGCHFHTLSLVEIYSCILAAIARANSAPLFSPVASRPMCRSRSGSPCKSQGLWRAPQSEQPAPPEKTAVKKKASASQPAARYPSLVIIGYGLADRDCAPARSPEAGSGSVPLA